MSKVERLIWTRTGIKKKELDRSKTGVIYLEEEVNQKGHKRFVQTGYTTIEK